MSSPTNISVMVSELTKKYPTRSGDLYVLRDVQLTMGRRENLAILGPSGSGKSTLLHILGTLDSPSSGTVKINDEDPFGYAEPELADFRNRTIGFVFQDHHLLPQCTVLENVLIPTVAGHKHLAPADAEARAKELIERVGLTPRISHLPSELSGGERQRVAIARSLIHRPTLMLCDEPTGNLDRKSAGMVADLLLELHKQLEAILVVVTHSAELAARLDKRMELVDGTLVRRT